MPVEKQPYRDAMARLGAAVNVITTDGPADARASPRRGDQRHDTPPTLLVCANRANDSYPAFMKNQVLCVNTLTPLRKGCRRSSPA